MVVVENWRRPCAENYENETVLVLLLSRSKQDVGNNENFNSSAQGG